MNKQQIITGKALLSGVTGAPISHSKSPQLHNYWLSKYNIDGAYIPINIKNKKNFNHTIYTLQEMGFKGLNVTAPYKIDAFNVCSELSKRAVAISSVNTLVFKDNNKIFGDSSDGFGFIAPLKNINFNFKDSTCLILGSGGSASAIIYELATNDIKNIIIANRTVGKACDLVSRLKLNDICSVVSLNEELNDIIKNVDLVINTTTLGNDGKYHFPFLVKNINPSAVVYDILYSPKLTCLLQQAKKNGNTIINGEGMLLYQATVGFKYWFNVNPKVTKNLHNIIFSP